MAKVPTKEKIKIAAQALFAEKGIAAVGVREIVKAAGQKNMASLHYYFRTKQDLVSALLVDAADAMENRREELLDELEGQGGPHDILDVLKIFIKCAIVPGEDPRHKSNIRLFLIAFHSDPAFVFSSIGHRENPPFFRCLDYCRDFMKGQDEDQVEARLNFMQTYVFTVLAARERALGDAKFHHKMWNDEKTVDDLALTAKGLLLAE